MSTDHTLDFRETFLLSSGTVSVDPARHLVLVLYHRQKQETLLPKGRKNPDETLEDAAIRETFEESGFRCRLVGVHPLSPSPDGIGCMGGDGSGRERGVPIEPIAVQQRVMSDGVRKMIFWYTAEVDSGAEQVPDTQEDGEDFEVRWVGVEDAAGVMSFEDDGRIVQRGVDAVLKGREGRK